MAYTIRKADGTTISVPDNSINNSFYNTSGGSTSQGQGVQLVGRNAIDYGTSIAQNFLQITENFASATGKQPIGDVALQGQLWYDKTLSSLYVRISAPAHGADSIANWQQVALIAASDATSGTDGQIKVNGSVISMWANGAWRQIWPAQYS